MSHRQAENERNAICDICGFKYKHYQLKKRWDGFMVSQDKERNVVRGKKGHVTDYWPE